ncbi:MAG: glutamine--fructose-6-phosphate transaminase (isomerizing) [Actinomycetota bacterium]|jgi:glucosamine--fructose-6-phosphate aminotransferase (isomerizing)|nr:glutamine--fructose-6-phosphate transaminase (isomerizing) [Actinomycetota bacterium]
MCGIIGATGIDAVPAFLVEGLGRLEYRGYDSAGLALVEAAGIWRARAAEGNHSVEDLAVLVRGAPPKAHCGIGHTRWATHGAPTVENAHPHLDCTGRLALVHNGIIENHAELTDELVARGHTMVSGTDSECVAHLIEDELRPGRTLPDAVRAALGRVRGSFAVAVVHADLPEVIVAARRSTPLVVGLTDGGSVLASDVPALLGTTRKLFALDDDQIAELSPTGALVSTLEGEPVEPAPLVVDWDRDAAQKGGFDDYMSKEMHEQPKALADTLLDRRAGDRTLQLDDARITDDYLRSVERVCIVACGSSFHAAMVAKYAIEHWARLPTEVDIASEFRYRDPVLDERTLTVGVSQSGETLDTLQALREARRWGSRVLAVSNVVGSSMAREADGVLYTRAGPEIGVASTKCHLAQVAVLEILALTLAQRRGTLTMPQVDAVMRGMHEVPSRVAEVLARDKEIRDVADALVGVRDFFYLGRGVGFPVAMEGALKLKELSYLRAEGYPAGELKHGPIALVEPGTVVVGVATQSPLYEKMLANIAEVVSRGATVVLVADDGDEQAAGVADHVLWVPATDHLLSPMVDVVPLQILAYHLARRLGNDVDRPRNLAKTVTVE